MSVDGVFEMLWNINAEKVDEARYDCNCTHHIVHHGGCHDNIRPLISVLFSKLSLSYRYIKD